MAQRITIDGKEVGGVIKTDIVQRPAIVDKNGKLTLATPEMELLPSDQLKMLARLADGAVVYRKFEVTYKEVKIKVPEGDSKQFCDYRDCWALADGDSNYCYKHDKMN